MNLSIKAIIKMWMAGGFNTNTKAKILSLMCLILFAKRRGIDSLQVTGNCKAITDWESGISDMDVLAIE